MKALFVAREYPPFEVGGTGIHTFNLVKNLEKIGVPCSVLSFGNPSYSNDEVTFIKPSSSVINKSNSPVMMDLRIPLDIRRMTYEANNLISNAHFDVVHVEEPYVGAFVKHERKVTTIHDTSYGEIKSLVRHDINFPILKRLAFYFSLGFYFELMCAASSKAVVVPSEQVKKELLEIYRISRKKITVIRNGVNIPDLFGPKIQMEAKKKLGLSPDRLLIFTGSQHIARKRLDVLVNAVSLLQKQKVAEYEVVIAGDGPLRPFLVDLTKRLGLQEIIQIPGWVSQEEMNLYHQATDIFVLTSEYEAGPISLLEAMSFGNVAVSSMIGGFSSLMINNIDGLLFPVGNYHYLSKYLGLLLNDAALRAKLSASARCFAEKFEWTSVAEDTKSLYEDLCQSSMH